MDEDQEKNLEDAKKIVREQGYFMKQALNNQSLRDALKFSTVMLSELKTTLLSPRNYFQLFMQIFDELRSLEQYFKEEFQRGRKMMDLYESVQHAQAIIPRLYLMVTVGSVYIESHEAKSKEILSDLLECIKGVQNPLKGLFLRYYFLMLCKDKLPDVGNQYEGEGGDLNDSINCILKNLTEMNNLWVRMQGNKEKSKREKERVDLKITVGENLSRLSKLQGINIEIYLNNVFPRLIELIEKTKDTISQQYLIDCLIQVFPDEYHLQTIEELLKLITEKVEPKVDTKIIIQNLMQRIGDFAENNSISESLNLFNIFFQCLQQLNTTQQQDINTLINLYLVFTKFSLQTYPDSIENINQIFKLCSSINFQNSSNEFNYGNLVQLLSHPLKTLKLKILQFKEYPKLMGQLPIKEKKLVAQKIFDAALQQGIVNLQELTELMSFIDCIIDDGEKIDHLWSVFQGDQLESMYELWESKIQHRKGLLWGMAEAYLSLGGINRIKKAKQIIDQIKEDNLKKTFHMIFRIVVALNDFDKEFDEYAYEMISQALEIYQEEIQDTEERKEYIFIIQGYLCNIKCLSLENYDNIASNVTRFAGSLLKKQDQCESILKCTHAFFNPNYVIFIIKER